MIIVMKQKAPLTAVENLETELNNRGFKVSRSQGESKVVHSSWMNAISLVMNG